MDKLSKTLKRWRSAHENRGFVVDSSPASEGLSERERTELKRRAGLPSWKWCRFGTAKFERRTERALAIKTYSRDWTRAEGAGVLSGATGVGKTLCIVALGHRLIDLLSRPLADKQRHFLRRVKFVRASLLVKAADRHPLGDGEPPLIARCVNASLLLCDDIGNEGPDRSRTLFEVIDRRYMASQPTLVTTYMSRLQLSDRYGDAFVRRLTDQGKFVTPAGVDSIDEE